jgi:hypothetical protein
MGTFKITNTTNTLGKRDVKHNTVLGIEYVDGMMKKKIKLNAGDSIYLTLDSLPISLHKLRASKLVNVVEVGESELASLLNPQIPKPTLVETMIISSTEPPKEMKKKPIKRDELGE